MPGVKFKVVEKGGTQIRHMAQKSNPTATPGCADLACVGCKIERKEGCRKSNICYEMDCQVCKRKSEQTDRQQDRTVYIGETSRNLFTRGKEHLYKYETNHCDSFMAKHQAEHHNGEPADFTAKVMSKHENCLSRQVAEGVAIRRCKTNVLNGKSEWHQPALWKVRSEIERG